MLIDTSGLFCYHHGGEREHDEAVNFFDGAAMKVSHSYVLAEFIPLCEARGLPRVGALTFASDLLNNPHIEFVGVNEDLHRAALSLLESRLDKTYSLCDAASFVLMRQYGINDALTTDRHFEQEGFARLLRP